MIKTFSKKPARHAKTYWVFKEMFWLIIQIVVTYSVPNFFSIFSLQDDETSTLMKICNCIFIQRIKHSLSSKNIEPFLFSSNINNSRMSHTRILRRKLFLILPTEMSRRSLWHCEWNVSGLCWRIPRSTL